MNSDNVKPTKCCAMGTYECQVPMAINGRRRDIDYCIADIVAALNAANITTVASCCGHNQVLGSIILNDGRKLLIKNAVRPWEIDQTELYTQQSRAWLLDNKFTPISET